MNGFHDRPSLRSLRAAPGRLLWALPLLFLASGCDRGLTDPTDGPMPVELGLYDGDSGSLLAFVHGSGPAAHWHGSLPVLQPGHELDVEPVFLDVDGLEIPLTDGRTVSAELASGAATGVIGIDLHGDHVHLDALSEGTTELVFHFVVDGEVVWNTPSISITVDPLGEGDPSDIDRVELENRATGDPFAHTDGSGPEMEWHGSLPVIQPGDELEVNVYFFDSLGRVITLGGEFEVGARLAEGSPSGVVELEPHGDHVDIPALDEGAVEIIFSLEHGGSSQFDAPPIGLEVEGSE